MAVKLDCSKITPSKSIGCYQWKRTMIYYPSNSKKGFPIKGTNLRVSFEYI